MELIIRDASQPKKRCPVWSLSIPALAHITLFIQIYDTTREDEENARSISPILMIYLRSSRIYSYISALSNTIDTKKPRSNRIRLIRKSQFPPGNDDDRRMEEKRRTEREDAVSNSSYKRRLPNLIKLLKFGKQRPLYVGGSFLSLIDFCTRVRNNQYVNMFVVKRWVHISAVPKQKSRQKTLLEREECFHRYGKVIKVWLSRTGLDNMVGGGIYALKYTKNTCSSIQQHQNCMMNGRPDTDYIYWRWSPFECKLPAFDPKMFLHFMRNKSMAFIGDSISRNQVQSLFCILSQNVPNSSLSLHHELSSSSSWPSYSLFDPVMEPINEFHISSIFISSLSVDYDIYDDPTLENEEQVKVKNVMQQEQVTSTIDKANS
ncbi:TRICHOME BIREFRINGENCE-LIKE 25 [Artemisia annua]|uniref:TRICHOME BIREFRINGENCE-LIKE 25 n=1 Tax=Artemisia annua TaxID=35608 RepID=A0A2U1KGZ1_ARTAN|nr:TRICHOME BIREFRINGENCE-LIKE 25 [Artemisia annua]